MSRTLARLVAPVILASLCLQPAACAQPVSAAQPPVERRTEETLAPTIPAGPADAVVEEGQALIVDPARDTGEDVSDMTIIAATAPEHGVLRIDRGVRLIYRGRAGFRGRDRFSYTLADRDGSQILASVTVQVTPAPPRPRPGEEEIIPSRFTASSAYSGYAGLNSPRGMRDGVYDTTASMHGTRSDGEEWIMADLGETRQVTRVLIACAAATAPGGWGCNYTNTAVLEVSADGVHWRRIGSVDGATEDGPVSFDLRGQPVRKIRLSRSHAYLAVGDFRVFGPTGPQDQ